MMEDTDPVSGGISRRTVLKSGVASMAAFTIGAGTVAADHGETGGSMLTVGPPHLREPFTAAPTPPFNFEIPASCQASESELKKYDIFSIAYLNIENDQLGAILRDDPHFDGSGESTYVFTSVQGCKEPDIPGVHRGSFRPL
jgi:hypothetical protein